jgi:hypothetical protein
MEDHSTPPLFDLKARQLDWQLGAQMLHFNDGLNVLHFTKTTIQPFQVITWHVGEIPAQWLVDHGRYECFRAGLTIIGSSQDVKDELRPPSRSSKAYRARQEKKADGPLAVPSWWVE